MKSRLQDNDIQENSSHNEEKSVVAEIFIRTLKDRIYKCMTSVSNNVYFDKLADIVKYNIKYHSVIKIKRSDVKSSTYIDFNIEKYQNTKAFLQQI